MNRRHLFLLALFAATLLLTSACSHKKPQPPPAAPNVAPTAPTVEVTAPSQRPQEADAVPSPLSGDLEAANEHAYRTGLLGDVYFDFDLASLTEDARARLARNADFLRAHPEFVVSIEGHCDDRGTNEYNLALGERRARSARAYLVSLGVAESRLRTISYGEERPVCSVEAEDCWKLNRRAHFVLVGRN